MRFTAVGLLAVGLLAGTTFAQDDAAKKEMKLLAGSWTVESAKRNGQDFDRIKGDQLVFEGERVTVKSKDRDEKMTYKLDPSKTPKAIDVFEPGKEKTIEGIYEVKGDTLRICFSQPGTARPQKFASEEGSEQMLVVLKRAKQ